MTSETLLYLEIAGLVFQAGMFYAGVRYLRRDVNGLGKKLRDLEARDDKRFRMIAATLFVTNANRYHKQIARLLREDEK